MKTRLSMLRGTALLGAALVLSACGGGDGEATARLDAQTTDADDQDARAEGQPSAGAVEIRVGDRTLMVELADDDAERQRGLMGRESLTDDEGMLFLYSEESIRRFWMKNTPLALDIAFIDRSHRIVEIATMKPNTEELTVSSRPAMYALEVRAGWFEDYDIRVGTLVQF